MNLTLPIKYKSLDPFSTVLPDFTILTGVNGAGKSQILSSILENQLKLTENGTDLDSKKYVTHSTLSPNDSTIVTRQSVAQNIEYIWGRYISNLENYKRNLSDKYNLPENHPRSQGRIPEPTIQQKPTIQQIFADQNLWKIIEKIAVDSEKGFHELTASDFYTYYPLEDGMSNNDVFYQNFSTLFKRYYDKLVENKFNKFLFESENQSEIIYLSDEKFIEKFGEEPWYLVNKILTEAKLDYYVNSPISIHPEAPFELKLINKFNKAEVKFSDLSSGEKVLISLALALYNSKFDIEFPKVLLMDEPDASLHPSMAKQFLEVIQKVFVEEKGVKVIITTHSPSTIALAPEQTLFVVNKSGQRIEKTTKDKALKILTSGVPSFSVNYENRRQVFVESPNDVSFYEKIYQILSRYLIPDVSLSFISSGDSRTDRNGTKVATCSQVENITKILRDSGNQFIWGIIDWDSKNQGSAYVIVLGKDKRYSIENYILDPILLSALLLREKLISREDIGLKNNETYIDFKNLNQNQLQFISDFLTNKVNTLVQNTDNITLTAKLINGIEIRIPKWYLHLQGHTLEDLIIKLFPGLNAIKRGKEEALKLEIINKVMDDIPELASADILETFNSVQKVD